MDARKVWVERQAQLPTGRLVFLDETGCNAAMARRTGWSPAGTRVAIEKPVYGTNVSLIGAIGCGGVRASMAVRGAVDGDVFQAFLRECLCPVLRPGDIVVMDNLRVHKVAGVREQIEAVGATVIYQPPYSPDLNPIELIWAWLKQQLRGAAPRTVPRLLRVLGQLLQRVTAEQCAACFRACGYQDQPS